MITTTLTVDFNGIVLFDPERLKQYFGGQIAAGTNVYRLMTTTQAGDDVLTQGIVVPIMGINDSTYEVILRTSDEPSPVAEQTIVSNGVFPLQVTGRLVLADMAVLHEWEAELGWQTLPVEPGCYAVTLHGFRFIADHRVQRFGFDIEIESRVNLPALTGRLDTHMQVLELPVEAY